MIVTDLLLTPQKFKKSEVAHIKSEVETNFIQIWNLNFQEMIPNLTLEYQKSIQKLITYIDERNSVYLL